MDKTTEEALRRLKITRQGEGSSLPPEEAKSIEDEVKLSLIKSIPMMMWWLYMGMQVTSLLSKKVEEEIGKRGKVMGNTTVNLTEIVQENDKGKS